MHAMPMDTIREFIIQCIMLSSMQEGWTALSVASWRERAEIVQILVQAGIHINIQGQVISKFIINYTIDCCYCAD